MTQWTGNLSLRAAGDTFREPATLCMSVHSTQSSNEVAANRENIPWNATVMVLSSTKLPCSLKVEVAPAENGLARQWCNKSDARR